MKYCGVVTDRSVYANDCLPENWYQKSLDRPRIYSDEVPMADEKTLSQFGTDKYIMRAAIRSIELGAMVVLDS